MDAVGTAEKYIPANTTESSFWILYKVIEWKQRILILKFPQSSTLPVTQSPSVLVADYEDISLMSPLQMMWLI